MSRDAPFAHARQPQGGPAILPSVPDRFLPQGGGSRAALGRQPLPPWGLPVAALPHKGCGVEALTSL